MSAVQISVVIPARDAEATLPDTLEGLECQRFAGRWEVIVVDDGSSDATARIALRSSVVSRVVASGGAGPGRARNAGAAATLADRLAFLDADCRPTPEWLAAGFAALKSAELVIGETRPGATVGPFDRTLSVIGCSPLFEAANLFVRRELFERLGGFEHWLGPATGKELGEDLWFGWRARRAGARIAACPGALVHHAVYPRGSIALIAERWRLRFFPALARRVPELRDELFFRRVFLSRRAARFDGAVLGIVLARYRPALAAAAIPYAHELWRDLREPYGARKALTRSSADAVGLAAMLLGSLRYRSLLL